MNKVVRWSKRAGLELSRGQAGFTLVELLIAVAILAAIGVTFLHALDTNNRATRQLNERVVASNLATVYLEAIKASPYATTYPNAGDNITVPFQYSVDVIMAYSNDGGVNWVDTYTNETLQRIRVTVSREGKPVLKVSTFRSER